MSAFLPPLCSARQAAPLAPALGTLLLGGGACGQHSIPAIFVRTQLVMATAEASKPAGQDKADPEHVNPVPEEMSLPSAAIQRIIKSKLPEGVMIGKEAKVAFSKASSIFILYVTTMCAPAGPDSTHDARLRPIPLCPALSANDLAKEARRTTVTAQDVLHALRDLEFDEFLPAVEACLHGAPSLRRRPWKRRFNIP